MKLEILAKNDNLEVKNVIISEIRNLICNKNLEPGDKLPSERVLSEKFGVSRRHVREAIKTLEFYELVKSIPQTGTFIAKIGQIAMTGIIDDMVTLENQNFKSLVETRILLESKTACLAAKNRTKIDLENIKKALISYRTKLLKREDAIQEDLLFHLAIAKASGNSTINALMLQITPKILSVFEETRVCDEDGFIHEVKKHEAIFEAIRNQDSKLAVETMEFHFEMLIDFCNNYKGN
ncbi:FCD domain-containing protein [uncultured Algibacter sp.]|uniref:FadR/GntR family transcriptional regulator n=1 Tax=uncultured Algibacter sp. TaxID=298659 RepID=UPI0030ECA2AE|tara:strand:+ start:257 stop:967 length:711 start_codon:yes stop_codon:yes gene_type:complete